MKAVYENAPRRGGVLHSEPPDDLRARAEASDLLLGLSAILAEVKSFEETLELAVKVVADAFRSDRCFAVTVDRTSAEIQASFGFDEAGLASLSRAASSGRLHLIQKSIEMRRPVLIADVRAAAEMTEDFGGRSVGAYICIPLTRWSEHLGAVGVEFAEPQELTEHHEGLAHGIARQIAVALGNARRFSLISELRTFGLRLASRLKLAEVVEEVANGACEMLGAEAASIYFLDASEQELVSAGGVGLSEEASERWARLDLSSPPWDALQAGATATVGGAADGDANAVLVRIGRGPEGILGAILVLMRRSVPLGADEEEALNVLAGQAALAIGTATRFQQQRQVAMSLQSGLLSPQLPPIEGFDVGAVYEPAGEDVEVGGDFYDVFDLHDGRFGLVVGDVAGKGAEAAALMAMAKYMLRAFAFRNPSPSSVLFHLNNALVEALGEDRFVTIVYGVLAPDLGELTIAGGGHPRPVVFRADSESVDLVPVHGMPLGAFSDQHFEQEIIQLAPGDAFAAYTDGLIEARNAGVLYGTDRVIASFARHARTVSSAHSLARVLHEDAGSFGTIADDTVVLALTRRHQP